MDRRTKHMFEREQKQLTDSLEWVQDNLSVQLSAFGQRDETQGAVYIGTYLQVDTLGAIRGLTSGVMDDIFERTVET